MSEKASLFERVGKIVVGTGVVLGCAAVGVIFAPAAAAGAYGAVLIAEGITGEKDQQPDGQKKE